VGSVQRVLGCRIARARRATAVYLRNARAPDADRFFRAVIAAHSRAREYAAATPRRSILHASAPAPKRAHIGNVFLEPKKHRGPHFDNTAERSPMVFGAMRDQRSEDDECEEVRDCCEPI
jgi:hypothetical protein